MSVRGIAYARGGDGALQAFQFETDHWESDFDSVIEEVRQITGAPRALILIQPTEAL